MTSFVNILVLELYYYIHDDRESGHIAAISNQCLTLHRPEVLIAAFVMMQRHDVGKLRQKCFYTHNPLGSRLEVLDKPSDLCLLGVCMQEFLVVLIVETKMAP